MEGDAADDTNSYPATVGEKLRAAREGQGLDLAEIASRTRIPQRHLEAIEQSNFSGLPSRTYAVGFARAYARAVGIDEIALARDLRVELGNQPERILSPPSYQYDDPSRVPPPWIAWAGAILAVLALIGVGLWYGTGLFRGEAPAETFAIPEPSPTPGNATAATAPAAGGQVTLVATDTVWLRVADASGKRLLEKEMAANERYDVPADADRPRVRTGRPDRLQVLLNGSQLPPLGSGVETVEVEVTPAALQSRGSASTSAGSVTAPAPGASAGDNAATPR